MAPISVHLSTGCIVKTALDALIEELERGTWRPDRSPGWPAQSRPPVTRAGEEAKREKLAPGQDDGIQCRRESGPNWPAESLDYERRFGQPHAKLFPYMGRKVRTPGGLGTLIQVFAGHVTVVLDTEISRCSFFVPGQIEPVSWDSADE
jgi:hypothetical protein